MRRANYFGLGLALALALLLSACGKPETPPTPQPAAPLPSKADVGSGDANQNRLVRISRFDCVASTDLDDAADFPWSKGISLWSGGGPGGAAWNAGKLRCAVEFQTTCTQGEADTELRIGGALSGSQHAKIESAGTQRFIFDLAAERWEQHFDQGSPLTQRFPYQTATFSASITASCEVPEAFGPSAGPRLEFADDRHFTAGFASGE